MAEQTTAIKERPILMSPPMFQATWERRKTQTRRIVKGWAEAQFLGAAGDDKSDPRWWGWENEDGGFCSLLPNPEVDSHAVCPYGAPGDQLWVKHAHWHKPASDLCPERVWDEVTGIVRSRDHNGPLEDRRATLQQTLDVGGFKKRPGIFLPRWACRLVVGLESVRAERLQRISAADLVAEGQPDSAIAPVAFMALWERLNGEGSWDANPWVWVLTFGEVAHA